jgi:sugar lactone lactonase YvrE
MADTIELQPIAQGYYLEALLVEGDTVWYGDVIVGGINRLAADGSSKTWLPERRMVGGLLLKEDGAVLVSGADGVHWFNPANNQTGVLIDSVNGEPLKGVNEMRPDGKGGMYFGGSDMPAIEAGTRPGPVGLYRLDTERRATQLCEGLVFTNGLTPNRDGTRLFHNESFVGTFAYDVQADGSLTNRTQLLEKKDCDGMAIDVEGNLWISGFASGELLRVKPDGTIVQRIGLPGDAATNVRFGGSDGRDVYITVVSRAAAMDIKNGITPTAKTSTLYRGRSEVAGQPIPRTRFRLG